MIDVHSAERVDKNDERMRSSQLDGLDIAAICWLTHEVRTASYARYLGATLYNIHYLSNRHPIYAPFKYIPQCLKTWFVLVAQKPDLVYVMNPPVFAALSVYIYSLLSSVPFIMDTHTPSLYGRRWGWTLPLQRFLAKKAFVNIIDQERFGRLFDEWGAPSVILERPPLDIGSRLGATYSDASNQKNATFASHFHIAVVSTFSSDEPLDVVIQGAARLPDVTFSILGDTDKAPKKLIQNSPSNVHYPGYLMGSAYWEHLQSADAIMVLTTFSHSLLGGAQEGMALGKPLILSGQPALTNYFTQGALFIEHDGESIVDAVIKCRENYTRLCAESSALSVIKRQTWHDTFRTLELTLLDAVKPRK